jgi:hypothetical protein
MGGRGGVGGGEAKGPSWRGRIRRVEGENKRGGAGGLSSLMHLGGPSRVIKFLYSPAPPSPTVWALPCGLVPKTTYAPMNYKALCIMFWMRAYPLLGEVGGGWTHYARGCINHRYIVRIWKPYDDLCAQKQLWNSREQKPACLE